MSAPRKKRVPVRTQTVDEDDTLRLAHLLKSIMRRSSFAYAMRLVQRAAFFSGYAVTWRDGKVVDQ